MENLYDENHIRTYSGVYIDPFNPNPDAILIEDIAHALAHQPRFGGHLPTFYSVAQHSVQVSVMAPELRDVKMQALMHDASEAYLIDIPRPIKHRLSNYKETEEKLMIVIAQKFGFDYPLSKEVKEFDEYALQFEWDTMMIGHRKDFSWSPMIAKSHFLRTFRLINEMQTEPRP